MRYYGDAAAAGNSRGQCALAAMLLKGEGGEKNVSEAIRIYEVAAGNGSVSALNGLGFVYFFGNEMPKNMVEMHTSICDSCIGYSRRRIIISAPLLILALMATRCSMQDTA